MNILVLGATGLIGSNVAVALLQSGYKVIAASRNKPTATPVNQKSAKSATSSQWREIDFVGMTTEQAWLPHLKNIDVVINCVGIIREVKAGDFDVLHRAAPSPCLLHASGLVSIRLFRFLLWVATQMPRPGTGAAKVLPKTICSNSV
ncbi:SDR family NAD(P)-dependent oxidoreductase [Undibacterium sp. RTI2.1]|uniref:SDR family NAD(P)-dependent oxidoreductase n=1 Tax=unclassified Undibacterium TaxID=2630295 RepID=UPI002AB53AC6|nr:MULTISPECIES: SDR family NAD(P)-dependent oxidoreductase [unclassified Undibacterium]MDY7538653.1 SDR family NAD(P)-dependent oxidoreductase [Undibacterium sp. 5I1]MEB0030278.1 SDR family NAD(P)-dependent oxidoreductase [Undibacterium sp. RTI2.1]MEB0116902.1 SDR family NAD(P)-dependent oxidoreductase [Undibacterium sp. RTI2.2]MEB0232142.1 SDR family NAD(P)-dependent oxidoreductase [Undibacterium sp. 10I3]MEB0259456.1 SDR family NAD(P)-dependent oxidoreductase [Undibacterium sp. 5I1]